MGAGMTRSYLPILIAAGALACGAPAQTAGPATVKSVGPDLTLHAEVSARGRDGSIILLLKFPDARCPVFPAELAADANGSMVYLQAGTGAAPDAGLCTLPKFRGPLPQGSAPDLALQLSDLSGAAKLTATAVFGGRTLKLTSATAGTLHAGEEATVEWLPAQFTVLEGTTPLLALRAPTLNEGGAQMEVLSVTGATMRFRVPSGLAAGSYKLALDGSARPAITKCEGAKSCELTLDASELATVAVDLL
jgi:hypothetical protein